MERCVFCRGELNPTTRLCTSCGLAQPSTQSSISVKTLEVSTIATTGEVVVLHCPNCQKTTRRNANFCPVCGYRLKPVTTSDEKADAEDLKDTFKEKLIDLKNMSPFLRVLLFITFVQIGVVTLLFLTKNLAQPLENSTVTDANGKPYVVSLTVFIIMAISIGVGYWFALAGAFYVHWSVRLPVVLLATCLLAITPIIALVVSITTNVEGGFGLATIVVWLRGMQLGVLAIILLWAIRTVLREWYKQHDITKYGSDRQWYTHPFSVVLVLLLAYYALELGVWLIYQRVGINARGTTFFLQPFGIQALLLTTLLSLVLIMGSSDLLEWGKIIAGSIVTFIKWKRVPRLILILTPLTATSVFAYGLWLDQSNVLLEMVIALGLASIVALLARFARIGQGWPTEIPASTILVLAIFLYIYATIVSDVIAIPGLPPTLFAQFYAVVSMPIAVIGLTIGLLLIALGRVNKATWGAIGLCLSMMVFWLIAVELPSFLSAFGLLVAYPANHFSLLNGIKMLVALGTLIWIIRHFIRQTILDSETTKQFATAFLLLFGLQTVSWVHDLLKLIGQLQGLSTVLLAGLFLLTVVWSLLTSGKSVTNTDSSGFPRAGRTLLYLGYTLIANATLLFLGTLTVQGTSKSSIPDYLTNDFVTLGALDLIGPSLVVLSFLLQIRPPTSHILVISSSPPSKVLSSRTTQFSIIGGGILVTLLLSTFIPVYLSTHSINLPYSTTHPGPGCDTNGANWSIAPGQPISTSCLLNGLQIAIPAHRLGAVRFELPSRTFPKNYRVSIKFIDSTISSGCVFIEMRVSGANYYTDMLCSDFSGSISLTHNGHFRLLSTGKATRAKTYMIEATTDGTMQRLAINRVVVASISDVTLSHTDFVALGVYNSGNKDAVAVFSNFIYTPLT